MNLEVWVKNFDYLIRLGERGLFTREEVIKILLQQVNDLRAVWGFQPFEKLPKEIQIEGGENL